MADQEQPVSKWSHSLRARIHIFAYVFASIFLYIEGGGLSNSLIQMVGIVFLIPAFLLLLGQLRIGILKRVAKFADDIASFSLYVITIVIFIKEMFNWVNLTEQIEVLWAIPVVLFAFIVYDIIDVVQDTRAMARSTGKKASAIRQLKVLSFVLIYFVLLMLAFDVQGIGKPFFWLTPAVISLMVALFLDGTFKK